MTETGGRSGSPTPPRPGGKRVVDLIEAMDKEEADADIAEIRRQHQHRGGETAGAAAAAAAAKYTLTARGQAAEATTAQLQQRPRVNPHNACLSPRHSPLLSLDEG